ncbi:inositol monophosphatase family protein [Brevibacterium otitidis]|uniref:Inositol monophosphatase family protein n=1 Tax=Brevibacterium otitidis TaxID=53364 RepID=A0ABV5X1J2_9MICO|nr:inositol monophosphatase family protein [Brevibacterium otitidis]
MDSADILADPLLALCRDAAHIATARMRHWRRQLSAADVEAKGERNNLVTAADAEIEALVRWYLATRRPGDAMIGEEDAAALPVTGVAGGEQIAAGLCVPPADGAAAGPQSLDWHVDPIDGTVNFVRGIEDYSFSIGVRTPDPGDPDAADPDTWLAGLVAGPELGKVFLARRGRGAWMFAGQVSDLQAISGDSGGQPAPEVPLTRLRGRRPGQRGRLVATGFGYGRAQRDQQFAVLPEIMEHFDDMRRAGSAAIDLCQAAAGRVDVYYERRLGLYDYAAGALIAEEAGLHVYRPSHHHGTGDGSDLCIAAGSLEDLERIAAIHRRQRAAQH